MRRSLLPTAGRFLSLGLSLLALASSPAPAQVITPLGRGVLTDVNGKLISEVFSTTSTHLVHALVRINGDRVVVLNVGRFSFGVMETTGTNQTVYFETADCTGQAYIQRLVQKSFGTPYRILGPDQTLYLGDPPNVGSITVQSALNIQLQCNPIPSGGFELAAMPAEPMTDLLVEFTPPFIVTGTALTAEEIREIEESLPRGGARPPSDEEVRQ